MNARSDAVRPHGADGTGWWYVAAVVIVAVVSDGWSGRPSPLLHQLLILPFTMAFAFSLFFLLRIKRGREATYSERRGRTILSWLAICFVFELLSLAAFLYEGHHFARFGYGFGAVRFSLVVLAVMAAVFWAVWKRSGAGVLAGVLVAYGAGLLLAIRSFPLNYLRSDMLPVIEWSDGRLISGLDPYVTIHVGSRLYDFPYLPGMLVAYLPAAAAHLDLRFMNLMCMVAIGILLYWASHSGRRMEAAMLIGVFFLSPFLQYRHDLYLAPHWLTLAGAFVLMQRRHYAWAAAVFGVGMAIYQLSWVLFPFFLLNGLRRRGWREAMKLALIGIGSMLVVVGPFLPAATRRIASNTVGQWSRLPHAIADPMNLSYWLTFVVRPDRLKWVQLVVLAAIFLFCVARRRCRTLVDMLRWMSLALALFIALNVLVDGYFYLTLLLLLLIFTCAATGIWEEEPGRQTGVPWPGPGVAPASAD